MSRVPGAERPQAGAGKLERISFQTLEVWNIERAGNIKSIELIAIFNVQGRDNRIVYHLYDSKNNVISEGYPRIYNKGEALYPKFFETETPDGIVRMEAYLVDANNHRISNIPVETLYLKKAQPASGIGQRALEDPQFNLPEFPEAIREASSTAQNPELISAKVQRDILQVYVSPEEAAAVIPGPLPFVTKKPETVFQPKFITLSRNTQNIINNIESGSIIVPAWFMNNVTWVKSGQITETEFINAYNFLSPQEPEVTIAPLPEITLPSIPEVSAVMELITTNFQVKLNNIIQFSSSLSNADYKRLQDEMSLEPKITLVFLNQTDFNPLSNFSKILRQIQNLLQKQVVETITIGPTGEVITAPEPTVAPGKGLMGAGVLGLIGILMLGGFIADHMRRKR